MNDARWRCWRNGLADGLAWAVSLVAVLAVVTGLFGLLVGIGALLAIKLALFVVGWLLLGVGTFMLRPRPPDTDPPWPDEEESEDGEAADGSDEGGEAPDGEDSPGTGPLVEAGAGPGPVAGADPPAEGGERGDEGLADRIGTTVQAVPPARWLVIPPDDRLSLGGRLFAAAVTMLALSFLLETAGVTV